MVPYIKPCKSYCYDPVSRFEKVENQVGCVFRCFYRLPTAGQQVTSVVLVVVLVVTKLQKLLFGTL